MRQILITALFALSWVPLVQAQMMPATNGDLTSTLPKGRILISAVQQVINAGNRFTDSGQLEKIKSRFNRTISWNDVLQDDPSRSAQLQGLFLSNGINLEDSPGRYEGNFSGQVSATVPVLGYGFSNDWGIYAAIPIVRFQMSSQVQYVASASAVQLVDQLENTQQGSVAEEFRSALNQGFQQRLSDAGYDYRSNIDRSFVGDIRLEVPYIYKPAVAGSDSLAVISTIILPTATVADPRDLYQTGSGERRGGLGARAVYSMPIFHHRFTLTTTGGPTLLLPSGERAVRVPRYSGDVLSRDIDESSRLGWGLQVQLMADLKFQISRSWAARMGLQHQNRLIDSLNGTRFSAERYEWAQDPVRLRLESAWLNIEFNSIQAFLDQDLPIPFQLLAGIAVPLSGRNVIQDPSLMLQTTFFF
jgi:hypothetical protein